MNIKIDKVYSAITARNVYCRNCENSKTYFPVLIYFSTEEVLICCTVCGESQILYISRFLREFDEIDSNNYSKLSVV